MFSSPTFTGTVNGITKSMVGLQNVDNTTDLNKPISTATQTALTAKENPLSFVTGFPVALVGNDAPASISRTGNVVTYLPAIVTAGTVGLQNVTNESKATMFSSPTFTGNIKTPTQVVCMCGLNGNATLAVGYNGAF